MNLYSLNTLAIALIAIGLVIPTGAVMASDEVWEEHGIVLRPHDSPNGEAYAEIGPDGNLSIDLATVGVNPNALTTIRNLFDISNTGNEALEIWITHNATDSVEFSVVEHGSIQGKDNNLTIGADQNRTVDLLINTRGISAREEPLLTEFEIHVKTIDDESGTGDGSASSGGSGTSGSAATPTPAPVTPTPTPEPTPTGPPDERVEDVEVILDQPTDGPVTVEEVPVEEVIGGETDEDDTREPRAVINLARGQSGTDGDGAGRDGPASGGAGGPTQGLQAKGADALVEEGEEVTLSATRSVLGSVRAVDQERRLIKAVNIEVPPGREDDPATIRMRVNEERFEATDLSKPRIGHETDDGWQMLQTRIVGREDGQLILEARTPGFSRFAVFATPEVRYTWLLNNETITAEELRTRFDEPGFHNITLTVTDALGRSSTATYRVLVNDRPSVSVDVPANRTAGEPLTLRANLTNEVGNATVTWLFPDGSQQEGLVVEHTFERGDQSVRVTVEDEFGASATLERTISFGPVSAAELVVQRIAAGVPLELAIGAVGLLAFILAILVRRVLPIRRGFSGVPSIPALSLPSVGGLPIGGSDPRIVSFEDPVVDVFNRQFQIGHLRIEDPGGDLRTVEIVVNDSRGNEVAQKTVDLRGQSHYETRREVVLPKSRVYVRDDGEYEISVRAGDGGDAWARRSYSSIRAPDALVA